MARGWLLLRAADLWHGPFADRNLRSGHIEDNGGVLLLNSAGFYLKRKNRSVMR
jgi:hypothetical protein